MFIASHRIRKLPKVEDERRLCKPKCLNAEKCIFCEQDHEIEQLSSVQTFEQDSNIRTMAALSSGDPSVTGRSAEALSFRRFIAVFSRIIIAFFGTVCPLL